MTTRGFNEADLDMVADAIAMIIADPEGNKAKATEIVKGLTDRYPLYELTRRKQRYERNEVYV